jgi:hypothetical protein
MSCSEDRIAAILNLEFPTTLKELEKYLGLTGWLRIFVPYYAQISEALQCRKTALLKKGPSAGPSRKNYTSTTVLTDITKLEIDSFNALQDTFRHSEFLHHPNPDRYLYLDVDASKEHGFGVMLYHMEGDDNGPIDHTDKGNRHRIQPILFLSKLLTGAESRYWPTELEVACLVWAVRKVRHIILSSKLGTIVYTDHSAIVAIAKQDSLSSSSTDKLNLRLVRASLYLSQFSLDVRYRSGPLNIVPDALSRLANTKAQLAAPSDENVLEDVQECFHLSDEIGAYNATMIEMDPDFAARIKQGYAEDTAWQDTYERLRRGGQVHQEFVLNNNGLIYYIDPEDSRRRLCLPKQMEKEVFASAHDDHAHAGFHRAYDRLRHAFYVRGLAKCLRAYIRHCHICNTHQTMRHKPYGQLKPITTPVRPYHTVSGDFIVGLPLTATGMDAALTLTCKFSKRVKIIPGKTTWSAVDWAHAVFANTNDWGVWTVFIVDRDSKWLSLFWRTIFTNMGTKIAATTAYHPQSDGQSERTNQTVEIALRMFYARNPDKIWIEFLDPITRILNSSKNASTGKSPDEIVFGFDLQDSFGIVSTDDSDAQNFEQNRKEYQQEARDCVAYAQLAMKKRYDNGRMPLIMNSGDKAFINLHEGYRIPGTKGKKLGIQRIGPCTVLRRVSPLAYELEIPSNWRIHPVISITHLEPAPHGKDPYDRKDNDHPPPLEEGDPNAEWREFSIETLLDRRHRRYGKGKKILEYLVKWEGYGPEFNEWYGEDLLDGSIELMLEYELRCNNDPERIDYLKKLDAKGKSGMTLDTPSIPKRRTRKIKNSRLGNSPVTSTVVPTTAAPATRSEFSVVVPAVSATSLAGSSAIPISATATTHNDLSVPIGQKRGRGRPRKN